MDKNVLDIVICDDDLKIITCLEEMILSSRPDAVITKLSSGEEVLDWLGRASCDLLTC